VPLVKIKIYDIAISGHLSIQATNGGTALKAAEEYVLGNSKVLNYAMTESPGYQWVELPPPPPGG
jgi:hypothetical protein